MLNIVFRLFVLKKRHCLISPLDWLNLSLDDKTANKMLWISDNGSKVCRRTEEVCPVLDRPERYEYSPQVSQKTYIYMTFI